LLLRLAILYLSNWLGFFEWRRAPCPFGMPYNLYNSILARRAFKSISSSWAGCREVKVKRLPESLGNLTNLQSMNMKLNYCRGLERLPSIKTLLSLEELRASDCVKLKSIPDLAQLTKLRLLNVKGCLALEELDDVEHCKSLVELNTIECPNLKWGDGAVNKLRQQNTKIELK